MNSSQRKKRDHKYINEIIIKAKPTTYRAERVGQCYLETINGALIINTPYFKDMHEQTRIVLLLVGMPVKAAKLYINTTSRKKLLIETLLMRN